MSSDIAMLERIDDTLQIGTMTLRRTPLGRYVPTYVSEQVLRLLGYGKDEFMEKFADDISPIFAKEEQDRIAVALSEFLDKAKILSLVVRLLKKDGTVFTSMMRFSFLEKDTVCVGFVPFTQEDQLWLDVMEDTSVGIHLINADTYQLYYSNPAGFTLSGTKPHPYQHMHCYEAFFNRKSPCGFCNCKQQKEGSNFSEKILPNGKVVATTASILDWKGKRLLLEYAADITQYKDFQTKLKDLFDHVPGGVCLFRIKDGKFNPLIVSKSFTKLVGKGNLSGDKDSSYAFSFEKIHPVDALAIKQALKDDDEASEKDFEHTFRIMRGKEWDWYRVQAKCLRLNDGSYLAYTIITNVTKTKEMERELQDSTRELESAMEHAGLWYWTYDFNSRQAMLGDRVLKDFPFIKDQLASFVDEKELPMVFPEYQATYQACYQKIKAGVESQQMQMKVRFPDGTIHWMRLWMTNLFSNDGNQRKLLCTAELIDVEKALEARLDVESKKPYQMDSSRLAYRIIDLTKNEILETEKSLVGIYDPSVGQTLENAAVAFAHSIPDESSRVRFVSLHNASSLMDFYNNGGTSTSMEYRKQLPNGTVIWVKETLDILRNPSNNHLILYEYCFDIHTQKMLGEIMKAAVDYDYEYYSSVSLDHNQITYLHGGDEEDSSVHTTLASYSTAVRQYGEQSVLPSELIDFLSRMESGYVRKQFENQRSFEFTFHTIDGRTKKNRFVLYDKERGIALLTRTDVTELLKQEERKQKALARALRMANAATKAKSTFLSNMSHEIRTPMTAVIGMTKLAKETAENPQTKAYLDEIDSSSAYLLGIINDILDISRIESGKFTLNPDWTTLPEALSACIDMLKPQMQKKDITFLYPDVQKTQHIQAWMDKLRVQQIFMNLLSNALKFTPQGGTIAIKCENVSSDAKKSVDRIEISDTGCGMSEEFMKRIFKPFEQERNIYSDVTPGTGLGLALVKKIITKMDGTITVKSKLGEGSTFTLTMPYLYRVSEKELPKRQAVTETDFTGKTIMVAEDHPLNLEIAMRFLEKKNATVVPAHNGKEAFDLFVSSKPGTYQAILMDVRMPILDGLASTRAIRSSSHPDAKTIPIIAMTANALDEDRKETKSAGMNDHVSKPFEIDTLYATLAKWMGMDKK